MKVCLESIKRLRNKKFQMMNHTNSKLNKSKIHLLASNHADNGFIWKILNSLKQLHKYLVWVGLWISDYGASW